MKGYRFHAELPEDWGSKSGCKTHEPFTRANLKKWAAQGVQFNVFAADVDDRRGGGVGAIFSHLNSPVTCTNGAREWLRKRTVRIDEATARKLHPALFAYLDD